MAHATLWTFIVTPFMSPHPDVSTEHTNMEVRFETTSQRKKMAAHCQGQQPWLCTHQCKKVSHVLPEKILLHIYVDTVDTRHKDL